MTAETQVETASIDLRTLLREKTANAHQSLDDQFSRLNLKTPEGYGLFLKTHHMALGHCYRMVDTGAAPFDLCPPDPLADLSCDIEVLGQTVPQAWDPIENLKGPWLGTAYVLCGARLGARVLIKRVQTASSLIPATATTFLKGQQDPEPWRLLVASLNAQELANPQPVIDAAQRTFQIFEQALGDLV